MFLNNIEKLFMNKHIYNKVDSIDNNHPAINVKKKIQANNY